MPSSLKGYRYCAVERYKYFTVLTVGEVLYFATCLCKIEAGHGRVISLSKASASAPVSPNWKRNSGLVGAMRSSQHPQASLTIQGKPLAIASLTTSPQVSL